MRVSVSAEVLEHHAQHTRERVQAGCFAPKENLDTPMCSLTHVLPNENLRTEEFILLLHFFRNHEAQSAIVTMVPATNPTYDTLLL